MTERNTPIIERVAKALYDDQCRKHSDSVDAKTKFYEEGIYHDAARIALAAMREPTEAMVAAAWANALGENAVGVWQDMIDAALGHGELTPRVKEER